MELVTTTINGVSAGPHLLILAGVHGDEYEPIAAVRALRDELSSSLLAGRVTLVPIVNVPAFQRGQRTAEDGLDLARTCPGKPDGSVTEQIAHSVLQLIRSADLLIDLHTGGLAFDISPLSGYTLHPQPDVLATQRRMARAFNLPIVWGTNPHLEGRTLSVARDARIPAIYAEWGGGGGCRAAGVRDYVTGCRQVLREFGMLDDAVCDSRATYIVEDARPQSGVLQNNYVSEAAGSFEPSVALNDIVQPGDVLGYIHSLIDRTSIPVLSRQQGLVLLLRRLPPVQPGDSLAVVLETTAPGEVFYG